MPRSRFVRPEAVVLPISNGDSITVRKELSNGERRAMFARMFDFDATPPKVKPLQVAIATVAAYLLDWTLTDDTGQKVPIKGLPEADLIALLDNNLQPDTFTEIREAIERHVESVETDQKKASSGELISSAT